MGLRRSWGKVWPSAQVTSIICRSISEMISKTVFDRMKRKYGAVASWAVWGDMGDKPKCNMGNMDVFDLAHNPRLLEQLSNQSVMVALNFSRPLPFTEPFKNFHDPLPYANDFKIRYAFKGTSYYGSYMTDIIKNLEMLSSKDVASHLKNHPEIVKDNIDAFRQELADLETARPIILVFGSDAYHLLKKHLDKEEYSALVKLTHYSQQIGKEDYKLVVHSQISNSGLPHDGSSGQVCGENQGTTAGLGGIGVGNLLATRNLR